MKLRRIYQEIIRKGMEADPRDKKFLQKLLLENKKTYEKLEGYSKEIWDVESLTNPFADTRIVFGNDHEEIKSIIVGIDIQGAEMLLVDKLKQKGVKIDLVMSHHPLGSAYAAFYEVMDLQIDVFSQQGVNISFAEDLLRERKGKVERRVNAANHQRDVDIARWLDLSVLCVHTPADSLAYRYIEKQVRVTKPTRIGDIMDMLMVIPEYREAARQKNPLRIFNGDKKARANKVHIEFTGGTEGPKDIYERLSNAGVDTIIAMHQSEEHLQKCKEAHVNVIVAPHIASDNLGMNLMLDHLCSMEAFHIHEISGFRRFSHAGDTKKQSKLRGRK